MTGTVQTLSDILSYLSRQETDCSISQVAGALSMNRHSAAKYLTILHMLGQVELRTFGKVKLYRLSRRVPLGAIREIWDGVVIAVDRFYLVTAVSGDPSVDFPYPSEKILGMSLLHLPGGFFPSSPVLENLRSILEGKSTDPWSADLHEQGKWYQIRILPCVFENGAFGAAVLVSDVSEKQMLKYELNRWKDRYQALIREPYEMVLSLSPEKKINTANEAYLSFCRTGSDQVVGTDHFITLLAGSVQGYEKSFSTISRDSPTVELVSRVSGGEGQISWKRWQVTGIFSGDLLIEYVVSGTDITEKQMLEEKINRLEENISGHSDKKNHYIRDLEQQVIEDEEFITRLQKGSEERVSRYLDLLRQGSDYLWFLDPSETITACSGDSAAETGIFPAVGVGKTLYPFLIPDSILQLRLFFSEAKQDRSFSSSFELIFQAGNDRYVPVQVSGCGLFDDEGTVQGFILAGRDLSRLRDAEDENERKTHLLESITDFVGTCDAKGRILFLNRQGRRMLNLPDDLDPLSLNIFQFVSPRSQETITGGITQALQNGIWRGDSIMRSFDGEEIPVSQTIFYHETGIAQEISFSTILRDKRESIFHEREIARINSYNRSLIEASPDPMLTIGMNGRIQDSNKAAEIITGLRKSMLIGRYFSDIISPPGEAELILRETQDTGSSRDHRLEIIHTDGHETPVLFNGTIYRDETGSGKGILATFRDVSQQLKAESELRDSLQYYLIILDGLPNPIWRVSPEGRFDYFNQAWLEFRGRQEDEEKDQGWLSGIHPDDLQSFTALFNSVLTDHVFFFHELRLMHRDQTYHRVKMYARPLFGQDRSFRGFIGSCYDLEQFRQSEERARQIEREKALILDSSHDQVIYMDPDLRIRWVNRVVEEYTGMSSEELAGLPCYSVLMKRQIPCPDCILAESGPGEGITDRRITMPDGRIFHSRGATVTDDSGNVIAVIEINQDITALIDRDQEKELLLSIVEKTPDIIGISDSDHSLVFLNAAGRRILEIPPGTDIRQYSSLDFHPPSLHDQIGKDRAVALQKGLWSGETLMQTLSGRVFPVSQVVISHLAFFGRGIRYSTIIRDITSRIRAEEDLRRSEQKYRLLHENLMDAFAAVDMDGTITECNDVFLKLIGYSQEEIGHLRYQDLTPSLWHRREADIIETQVIPRGYSDIYEKEYRRADGDLIPVELRTILIRDYEGQPSGMWAIIREITSRNKAFCETDLAACSSVLVDAIPCGAAYLDRRGRLKAFNPAYTSRFGSAQGSRIGRRLVLDLPESIRPQVEKGMHQAMQGEVVSVIISDPSGPDGNLEQVTIVPQTDGNHNVRGMLVCIYPGQVLHQDLLSVMRSEKSDS